MKAFILLLVVFVICKECEAYVSVKRDGSVPAKCSDNPNGCCNDGKTRKKGPNNRGCGLVDCIDETPVGCKMRKDRGGLRCDGMDKQRCAVSCGSCKSSSPEDSCKGNPNCCWDGTIAVNGRCPADCHMVENIYRDPCRRFEDIYGGCSSGSLGIRNFMRRHCPVTCRNPKCF